MKSDISRLCLGTAQFGSHYGATNGKGKPDQKEIMAIVDCAWSAGIEWVDTSTSYPWHWPLNQNWQALWKVKAADLGKVAFRYFDHWSAAAILAHEPEAVHLVRAIKAAGYKGKIGQSVYNGDPIWSWSEVVQFPLNLADRRAENMQAGPIKFARSVFLQGKLLEMGYSVKDCLGYVLRQPVDYAIVGVNSVNEMEEIIHAAEDLPEIVPDIPQPHLTAQQLDPRTW